MTNSIFNQCDIALTSQELKNRLFEFNVTGNWNVFNDVPAIQQVNVMYPSVFLPLGEPPMTELEKFEYFIKCFKPSQETIEKVKEIARLRTQS